MSLLPFFGPKSPIIQILINFQDLHPKLVNLKKLPHPPVYLE